MQLTRAALLVEEPGDVDGVWENFKEHKELEDLKDTYLVKKKDPSGWLFLIWRKLLIGYGAVHKVCHAPGGQRCVTERDRGGRGSSGA